MLSALMAVEVSISDILRFENGLILSASKGAIRKSLGVDFVGETKDYSVLLADVRIEGFDQEVWPLKSRYSFC